MPVAGSNSSGRNVDDIANVNDIDIDSDSDYGWDLSLEEDVHELLNATATATAETPSNTLPSSARARLFVPVVSDAAQLQNDAAASQSLGPLAAAAVGATAVPHRDPVADDDDPSAAAVLDAALLGFDVEYPDCKSAVEEIRPEGERGEDRF